MDSPFAVSGSQRSTSRQRTITDVLV
ncbi:hypothetical protein HNR06_001483 [Nocardiopsis arvandica]|uniref:Uncharacterized protein n=1 Tax=Nocardiopsis sinuspersici TaxID=501010 RepID=A0A7Y9X9X0_9ACTN|nr:hypothetical protein [Nocardiopsis sinuspersici]